MTALQWGRATEIFDAALDLPPEEKSGFVRASCDGDLMVQAEVEGLLDADAEVEGGSFLNAGWLPPAMNEAADFALQSGDVISGRFRIVRSLGEGGMGRVYEAHDSELGVQVALKTLRPEVATNPEVVLRFRQEVRIAHRITHPNVCRTFHLDRERKHVGAKGGDPVDLTFITMEYLNGETLQQILRSSGHLPLSRALVIARQMADAIEAAHQSGIIHRDIKPGNVMICDHAGGCGGEERVVITDFGLAKFGAAAVDNDFSAISHAGSAMGTLPYMAPEQLTPGEVTAAADIFAFGAVLFEMVTGAKAFPDSTTWPAALQRASEDPPSPRALVPDLPAEWENAILGCLQLDPAARFQNACDVIDVLEGSTEPSFRGLSSVAGKRRIPARPSVAGAAVARRNRRLFAVAAAILVCVTLFWFGFRFYQSRADASVAPGTLVYLAPVKNETGEKQLDNVTELVRAGLEQSTHINLLDAERVGDILQSMTRPPETVIDEPTAREIAMRAGAARVVFCSIAWSRGGYRLNVEIQQPDNTPRRFRNRWKKSFEWRNDGSSNSGATIPQELLTTIRNSSNWMRLTVGESRADIARLDAPPEDVTTSSWEAFDDYTHAQALAQQNQRADAVIALKDAVRKDPQFALAYASTGDMLLSLHRDLEGFRAYGKALDLGLQNRLTRREEDRIRGMRAVDTADYQLAVDAFHDYQINYKNDYLGWAYPSLPLRMLKRDQEAIFDLRQAVAVAPKKPFAPYALAVELILEGQQEEALQWIEYLKRENELELAANAEFRLFFVNHRYADANRILQTLHNSRSPMQRSYSYGEQASLAAETGHYVEAISYLNMGIVEDNTQNNDAQRGAHMLGRAYLECKLNHPDSCLRDISSGYELNPIPENALRASTILGGAFALAPQPYKRVILDHLIGLQRSLPSTEYGTLSMIVKLRTLGEIQLASGNPEAALKTFKQAAAKDAPAGSLEYIARAEIACAKIENDLAAKNTLMHQALEAYSAIALRPAFVWYDPNEFLPGAYADQLEAYLTIANRLETSTRDRREAQSNFALLRPENSLIQ